MVHSSWMCGQHIIEHDFVEITVVRLCLPLFFLFTCSREDLRHASLTCRRVEKDCTCMVLSNRHGLLLLPRLLLHPNLCHWRIGEGMSRSPWPGTAGQFHRRRFSVVIDRGSCVWSPDVTEQCQAAVWDDGVDIEKWKMKNGLLRIAAQCWIVHETLKH